MNPVEQHLADERFAPGLAHFMSAAMKVYAEKCITAENLR